MSSTSAAILSAVSSIKHCRKGEGGRRLAALQGVSANIGVDSSIESMDGKHTSWILDDPDFLVVVQLDDLGVVNSCEIAFSSESFTADLADEQRHLQSLINADDWAAVQMVLKRFQLLAPCAAVTTIDPLVLESRVVAGVQRVLPGASYSAAGMEYTASRGRRMHCLLSTCAPTVGISPPQLGFSFVFSDHVVLQRHDIDEISQTGLVAQPSPTEMRPCFIQALRPELVFVPHAQQPSFELLLHLHAPSAGDARRVLPVHAVVALQPSTSRLGDACVCTKRLQVTLQSELPAEANVELTLATGAASIMSIIDQVWSRNDGLDALLPRSSCIPKAPTFPLTQPVLQCMTLRQVGRAAPEVSLAVVPHPRTQIDKARAEPDEQGAVDQTVLCWTLGASSARKFVARLPPHVERLQLTEVCLAAQTGPGDNTDWPFRSESRVEVAPANSYEQLVACARS